MENLHYHSLIKYLMLMMVGACLFLSCKVKRIATPPAIVHIEQHPEKSKLDTVNFQYEFKKILTDKAAILPYPKLIDDFYKRNNYQPIFVSRFLSGNQLPILLKYLNSSYHHGLDTALFFPGQLQIYLAELRTHKSTDAFDIYRTLVKLELSIANSLIRYSMALQFGITEPEQIYKHYTIPTQKPDSSSVISIFEVRDLKNYLDSIQPKDRTYLALQKALTEEIQEDSASNFKPLLTNLERLRWKNKPTQDKFVLVNIANFSLEVIDGGKSVLHMKVCVGEPGTRETPQLSSIIHSVQVNPVWNIPQSIVTDEISKQAAQDRYYLANSNINVYQKGKLINNPESIDWSSVNVSDYFFQQQPGAKNALGKIKFIFNNESSVYLHDTPIQSAFDQPSRAISHGCVRVENPLELTYALFGKSEKYSQIKKAIQSGYPRAKYFSLPKKIPIMLSYYTVAVDDKGTVQYYNDVYNLDNDLYSAIQKISLELKFQ